MTALIRCSRCSKHLPPEAFAPSQRKNGSWCKSCRRVYQVEYRKLRAMLAGRRGT